MKYSLTKASKENKAYKSRFAGSPPKAKVEIDMYIYCRA
jgi:hypothetical protein